MTGLRPLCRSYLSSTSCICRLRPLCRDYVLYLSSTSCICRLRPVSVVYVLYLSITSFIYRLRPLCCCYVLHVGITSFMTGLRPACRSYLSPTSCIQNPLAHTRGSTPPPSRYRHTYQHRWSHNADRSIRSTISLLAMPSCTFRPSTKKVGTYQ